MSELKRLSICIFNKANAAFFRVECGSISVTKMEKELKKSGVRFTDVAADFHGMCIQVRTHEEAKIVKAFIESQEAERTSKAA